MAFTPLNTLSSCLAIARRRSVAAAVGLGLVVLAAGWWVTSAQEAVGGRATAARLETMKTSPQWNDGRFRNQLPRQDAPLLKSLTQWARGAEHTAPDRPPPIESRTGAVWPTPPPAGLSLTWLGHSTTLVEIDGHRLLLDPVWSERASPVSWAGPKRFHPPPLPLSALPPLDAVVISHDHYDHLDHRTIVSLRDRVPLFVVPLGVGAHLERWGVSASRIVELDWWAETSIGALTLTATPARHFSGRSLAMSDRDATLWAGWAIRGPAHRVYFSGDTAMFPEFSEIGRRLGPFDASLIEVGAYDALWADVHLGPEQAIEAHRLVRGGVLIPVHWGTFDLAMHPWTEPVERLLVAASRAGTRVAIPKPGQTVTPTGPPPITRWWPAVPWRTAEAAPVVSTGLEPSGGVLLDGSAG
jgi:L-ascorbate metabolism protein UlaG (beta-lactamase superfamily)